MDLDAAIKEAAVKMGKTLPPKTEVALVSVASSSAQFSEYVISRLEAALVDDGKLIVLDRANLDKVRDEQGFQLSGEVDDKSAKDIGKILGAGAIVTGSFINLGDMYGLSLKAINMKTAAIAVSYPADIAKSSRIETLLASGGNAGAGGARTAQAPRTSGNTLPALPSATKTYKVGDVGPAGGLIFYDKGNSSNGWRYLEAAPASTESKVAWSTHSSLNNLKGTNIEIGTGKQNTQVIVNYSLNNGVSCRAAMVCDNLRSGGYDDWFLPSKSELNLMFVYLQEAGIGGFKAESYWSSSIGESWLGTAVWIQHFSNGSQNIERMDYEYSVRAIRQF
ncbi:hypothetical protein FACS189456_0580 [Bacteroidia bacterium]|nr:hypothetical protein FACS189456_0580 [Bacteroidia bacterium]